MPNITPSELRRHLTDQGFRVEDKKDGTGWVVMAPKGTVLELLTNPTGTVHIHTRGLRREDSRWTAIMGELRKVGFDPQSIPDKADQVEVPSLEEQTGMEVYDGKPPPNPDDPNDRWVTYVEAAEIIGLKGGSGVAQRVKAGKLRAVKMPAQVPGTGGRMKTVQAWHVNVGELLESSTISPGRFPRQAGPVTRRFEDTAAGRLSQAASQARAAMRKIQRGMEELEEASKVIDKETTEALQELRDTKQRVKEIEQILGKAVNKL